MRSALYNSLKASVVPYLNSKSFKRSPFQVGFIASSLKTAQQTLSKYKFRRIDDLIETSKESKEINLIEEKLIKENEIRDIPVVIITEEIPLQMITEETPTIQIIAVDVPLENITEEIPREMIPDVIPLEMITEEIPQEIIPDVIPLEIIPEEIPQAILDEIEPPLKFTFKKDIPLEWIVVGAREIESAIGRRKKKNILLANNRHLTWKNLTPIPDTIFLQATKLWTDNCGILFTQITNNEKPYFTFEIASQNYENDPEMKDTIAMAFFPDQTPRIVRIFKKFNDQFNQVAAIAHELGHIMGFCHEHSDHKKRHIADDLFEEFLSEYDPLSIMNYDKLWMDEKYKIATKLSDLDIKGAKELYGEPIKGRKELQMSG